MLALLPPERRRELTRRGVPLVIPGHERPKTIDVMTVAKLGKVIGGLVARPTPIKPIAKVVQGIRDRIAGLDAVADELVQGFRHRIAGLDAVADELVHRQDEIDDELAATVLDELRAVLGELEAALGR